MELCVFIFSRGYQRLCHQLNIGLFFFFHEASTKNKKLNHFKMVIVFALPKCIFREHRFYGLQGDCALYKCMIEQKGTIHSPHLGKRQLVCPELCVWLPDKAQLNKEGLSFISISLA